MSFKTLLPYICSLVFGCQNADATCGLSTSYSTPLLYCLCILRSLHFRMSEPWILQRTRFHMIRGYVYKITDGLERASAERENNSLRQSHGVLLKEQRRAASYQYSHSS